MSPGYEWPAKPPPDVLRVLRAVADRTPIAQADSSAVYEAQDRDWIERTYSVSPAVPPWQLTEAGRAALTQWGGQT